MSEELTTAASIGRDKDAVEGRFKGRKRRKVSYLTINKIQEVDYKDIPVLRRFVNERGKMLPSRQTGNTAKQQRMIARAIRRARELALLPFVLSEPPPETRGSGYRRERRERPSDANVEARTAPVEPTVEESPVEAVVETSAESVAEAPAEPSAEATVE